ncbi:hypothetical protein Aph01nite_32490 [Acrocarpospora phusangensis]|uniref:Uncharacterized protein n=1 Tax=Acrocarpospora phusangensis TaxID=1070424 RepID=A0A919QC13_9ACTN|nr:hypothetical protein Aph01nite_32490 [Acrocarpospora phusangensis]
MPSSQLRRVLAQLVLALLLLGTAPATASATTVPTGRVVLIGVPGLQWSDLDPQRTPRLWDLVERGASASLSTRTIPPEGRGITCPVAGWLTISAGQRAGSNNCAMPEIPVAAADGTATIPGWADLVAFQQAGSFKADIGLLAQTIVDAGGKVAAIGPGAALAAADKSGNIQKYAPTPAELPDLKPYSLVTAEANELAQAWLRSSTASSPETSGDLAPEARQEAARAADNTVGAILDQVPPDSTVLLVGQADTSTAAHLHTAIAQGPTFPHNFLTATSTRQNSLVTITDTTATVLTGLALPIPESVVGRTWATGGETPATTADTVTQLADADLASQVLRDVREPFFLTLVALQLIFYALAAIALRRQSTSHRRRTLTATQVVAVVSGAIPISTFLAQLVPWWSVSRPMPALIATILGLAGLIAAAAFAGPWRRSVLGPLTTVAAVSSLALLIDVMTGSRLQVNAVTGYEPVTGGRFYGFGNMAFAIYSTGTILALAGLAHALRRRPRLAFALCLGYGLLAIFADGWPRWGADFGGVPSFVLGFAVFMLMLAGRRVSVGRLAVVGAAGAALITVIAIVDWRRPADQRTHLGSFVQQVIDGEGGSVVGRKLGAMLSTLGNLPLTLLSLVALAFLFLVLSRPSRLGAAALSLAYGHAPALRAGLFGALTAALVGFLINDSGIAIPAMALTVAVPLTLAASVRALLLATPTPPAPPSAPAASRAPAAP